MVLTRSNRRQIGIPPIRPSNFRRTFVPRYQIPPDFTRRHRLADAENKSVEVQPHKRRKPKKQRNNL